MRKILFFTVTALFLLTSINAQSYKSSLTFQKSQYTVAAIQVPFEEDVVTDAVKDYMLRRGFKDAHYKDFIVFRDVPLDSGTAVLSDAYFNIIRKSHAEKDITVISLLPVKKGQTLLPANAEDSSFIRSSLVFLDSLKHHIHHYSLQQQITAQQKALDKISAKMISLKNDSGDIAKKIRNYTSELAQNKTDQETQTKVISNTATGDQDGLAKAHKKMDKLMDTQADYEKKLRNYQADLEQNTKDRATQQSLFDKGSQALAALKLRHQNLAMTTP
jgi:hypothetical protein